MYTDNPQEKEDFIEVTSKDRESESTKVGPIHCSICFLPFLKYCVLNYFQSILRWWEILTSGHYHLGALF